MSQHRSSRKKWLLRAAKLLVVVLVLWFVRRTLVDAWHGLAAEGAEGYRWRVSPGWLVLAGGIYLLGLLPAALFWYRVLIVLGQRPRLLETIRAYYVGHLGKYVPGKAMVVVIRAGLIRIGRVHTGVAAASVFVETLTMMAAGAFWAAVYLAIRAGAEHLLLLTAAIGLMATAGLPTLPPVFRRLARLAGVGRSDPETSRQIERLGLGTLAIGWIMMLLGWGILGLSFWAVLRGMDVQGLDLGHDWALYTASVSLAMVAGFLSLIPGGAVVREAILTELMVPYFARLLGTPGPKGKVLAVVSALLLRLVWLVSEVVISGILYVCGAWSRKTPPGP